MDLRSKKSMGVHYGTFQLTDEGIEAPVTALKEAIKQNSLGSEDFIILQNGESSQL